VCGVELCFCVTVDSFNVVGSGGFKVFHPMVFQRVIESLHLSPEYEKSKFVTVIVTSFVSLFGCTCTHVIATRSTKCNMSYSLSNCKYFVTYNFTCEYGTTLKCDYLITIT